MLKDIDFYHLQENIKKQLLDTGLGAVKTASKKVVHKSGEFLGKKVLDAIIKSKYDKIEKQEEETLIPSEKRDEILNKLRKV